MAFLGSTICSSTSFVVVFFNSVKIIRMCCFTISYSLVFVVVFVLIPSGYSLCSVLLLLTLRPSFDYVRIILLCCFTALYSVVFIAVPV